MNLKLKVCAKCELEFRPRCPTQIYCGSKTQKIGCSWDMVHERDRIRAKLPHRKAQTHVLNKAWKKKQRAENTGYADRQRALKRAYYQTEHGKRIAKESSKRNIQTKLECNRRRGIRKRGAEGGHSLQEWRQLKEAHGFKCVSCGVHESDLPKIWGKQFGLLTRDHIIPIVKGGTDYIHNIQPMCVSCNSRKWSK